MVTHHTASPITANARGRSHVPTRESRAVVSLIAVMAHCSALASAFRSPICSRFQATRQRTEQNRACSRRGTNEVPHCSQPRRSATHPVSHFEFLRHPAGHRLGTSEGDLRYAPVPVWPWTADLTLADAGKRRVTVP